MRVIEKLRYLPIEDLEKLEMISARFSLAFDIDENWLKKR
jgi:hypothetical protein